MMSLKCVQFAVVVGVLIAGITPARAQPASVIKRGGSSLDRYTVERDDAFSWTVVKQYDARDGMTGFAIDLTSQKWRGLPGGGGETSHPLWTHMMQVVVPDEVEHDTALLLIGGGRRQDGPPARLQRELWMIAQATGTIVVAVPNVPNQPLALPDGDGTLGEGRYEDDLLAESWMLARRTGDDGWVIHQAMVESAVAAMDAVQAFARSEAGGGHEVGGFVVSGGSKRGWTTWLTAAVDGRVRAIIPMVIDVLNLPATMRHHFGAYGFFAPAIGDYAGRNLMQELDTPEGMKLRRIVDPYLFRDRLDMPKFLLNVSGDQYFLPDTTKYYLDDLPGLTRLRVVPNWDHAVDRNADAIFSAIGFYDSFLNQVTMPGLDVEVVRESDEAVEWLLTANIEDKRVRLRRLVLWQGTNPDARDFRQEVIGKPFQMSTLEAGEDGRYRIRVEEPESGYTAFFVEHRYEVEGQDLPLVFTTQVRVIPDVLEHEIDAVEPADP